MEIKYISKSLEDTDKLAKVITENLFRGAVISLNGDLGAGKTTFTKSVGKYLGVKEEVSSPTFNILKCYFDGSMPLYHIDAYRLEDGVNKDIGLEEVIEGDGVCLIEWSCFIEEMVFERLAIVINRLSPTETEFVITSDFKKYDKIMQAIKENM
jgi:tRNA threonylcarbamoyladenosine biosynthesis protein TsaE